MLTTTISTKGQVIIPKAIRETMKISPGTELYVVEVADGILLKPKKPIATATLDELMAFRPYSGPAKSLEEMEEGIRQGILEEWGDRS